MSISVDELRGLLAFNAQQTREGNLPPPAGGAHQYLAEGHICKVRHAVDNIVGLMLTAVGSDALQIIQLASY